MKTYSIDDVTYPLEAAYKYFKKKKSWPGGLDPERSIRNAINIHHENIGRILALESLLKKIIRGEENNE